MVTFKARSEQPDLGKDPGGVGLDDLYRCLPTKTIPRFYENLNWKIQQTEKVLSCVVEPFLFHLVFCSCGNTLKKCVGFIHKDVNLFTFLSVNSVA